MAKAPNEATYCFLVEWYDQQAELLRNFHLFYYLLDQSIEMYDIKNRRTFLKRCAYPSIQLSDLYIGSQIMVYSRQLTITDYGDNYTKRALGAHKQTAIAIIKPSSITQTGAVLANIAQNGFILKRVKMLQLTAAQAQEFYGESKQQPQQQQQYGQVANSNNNNANAGGSARVQELSAGPLLALELIGPGVQEKLEAIATGADNKAPHGQNPSTSSSSSSSPLVLSSGRDHEAEAKFLFDNPNVGSTAQFSDCTVCVIKPHAVAAGHAGPILDAILGQGYQISAMELFNLDRIAASEFLEVYKSVVPEYNAMVEELCSGPCLALEVRAVDAVSKFRELSGPYDPDIARHIRPRTLRATFGLDKVKNGIHCTDLAEDGVLESEFFFSILQKKIIK